MRWYLVPSAILISAAAPAFAQSSIAVPEPSDAALFVVAVVGLIIGRQSSRKRPHDDAPDEPRNDG